MKIEVLGEVEDYLPTLLTVDQVGIQVSSVDPRVDVLVGLSDAGLF